MKKTDEARANIASTLLSLEIGATIPRTLDLARSARVGNGTVQVALDSLESAGAISTTAHGSLGRRLVSSDVVSLWLRSGRGALTGVMPLPESREFAGIATGISIECARSRFPVQLLFRQGNQVRIDQLAENVVDFSVMSRRAAEAHSDSLVFLSLGPFSYYSENSVAVIRPRDTTPPANQVRVAIDRRSSDHSELTLREFPDAVLVDTPYLFIPEAVANGVVDAAVWHRTTSSPLMIASGLSVTGLTNPAGDNDTLTEAAIAWRSDDTGVGHLIRALLAPDRIRQIQSEVMAGSRIPEF